MSSTTAVIGLGPMGAPIARNLLRAGTRLQVWNWTPEVARPFADEGAEVCSELTEIDAAVILSVLPDVPHLWENLTEEVLETWSRVRPLLVIMSTTSPAQVQGLASDLAPWGIRVADAPMSGGDRGAQQAALSLMVGADEYDFVELEPVLRLLGRTVLRFGEPGAGSLAKLANQVVVAGTLSAIGEAIALAERAGIEPGLLVQVLEGGLASSAVLSLKKEKLLEGDYSLGGSAANQLKDLAYATAAAEQLDAHVPLTHLLRDVFEEIERSGRGGQDHSVVLEHFRRGAGRRSGRTTDTGSGDDHGR